MLPKPLIYSPCCEVATPLGKYIGPAKALHIFPKNVLQKRQFAVVGQFDSVGLGEESVERVLPLNILIQGRHYLYCPPSPSPHTTLIIALNKGASRGQSEMRIPKLYRWHCGLGLSDKWSVGYETGQDHDLICILPNILDKIEAEIALSPVCSTRILAISAFCLKHMLLGVDENMGIRRLPCDNPNKEYGSQ